MSPMGLAGCLRHGIAAAVLTLHSPFAAAEEMSADNIARVLALVPEPQMLSCAI